MKKYEVKNSTHFGFCYCSEIKKQRFQELDKEEAKKLIIKLLDELTISVVTDEEILFSNNKDKFLIIRTRLGLKCLTEDSIKLLDQIEKKRKARKIRKSPKA